MSPACITAFRNGVLVQNHCALKGETLDIGTPTHTGVDGAPINLQAHGDSSAAIRFRNIRVRER